MSRYQLSPSSDEVEFEHLINALYNKKYETNSFQFYGKKGSKQHSIDGLTQLEE